MLGQVIGTLRSDSPVPSLQAIMQRLEKLTGVVGDTRRRDGVQCGSRAARGSRPASESRGLGGLNGGFPAAPAGGPGDFFPSRDLSERGINVSNVRTYLQERGELLKAVPLISGKDIRFAFLLQLAAGAAEIEPSEGVTVDFLKSPDAPPEEELAEGEPAIQSLEELHFPGAADTRGYRRCEWILPASTRSSTCWGT